VKFLYAQICDDIRSEQNGKDLLIGCYNNVMVVPEVPMVLPMLHFRLLYDDVSIGKHPLKFVFLSPTGSRVFGAEIVIDTEAGGEPFAVKLGGSPFPINEFGAYELRQVSDINAPEDKGTLLLSFLVRKPIRPSEMNYEFYKK
jgi:hypothetical protein